MSPKAGIFIDGEHGTTGLQIRNRLESRDDLALLSLPEAQRRDQGARAEKMKEADIVILCLPDSAARESVAMIETLAPEASGGGTRIIDASSAHRCSPDWVYGFPELSRNQPRNIAQARKVSNPGCYATGAIALLHPLISSGLLDSSYPAAIHAISGYSGGGKSLIARMEDSNHPEAIASRHFFYALGLDHKHVPEVMMRSGLTAKPLIAPSVGRFAQGMAVCLPISARNLNHSARLPEVHATLESHYAESGDFVSVVPLSESGSLERLDPQEMVGRDGMRLYCFGDSQGEWILLAASLDNLGKGAAGAAVRNLDIMLGAAGAGGTSAGGASVAAA